MRVRTCMRRCSTGAWGTGPCVCVCVRERERERERESLDVGAPRGPGGRVLHRGRHRGGAPPPQGGVGSSSGLPGNPPPHPLTHSLFLALSLSLSPLSLSRRRGTIQWPSRNPPPPPPLARRGGGGGCERERVRERERERKRVGAGVNVAKEGDYPSMHHSIFHSSIYLSMYC